VTKPLALCAGLLATLALFPYREARAVQWNSLKAGNPVLPGYFADPCCRKFGDTYYLYVTPDGWDVGKGPFCIWTSKDFVNWTSHKSLGVNPGTFWPATDFKWAPSVVKHNGKYYMYTQTPCMVWGAVGDTPLGPWKSLSPEGKPMIPDQTPKGSIVLDGEAFIDDDGQVYIWYSTWWTPTVAKLKSDMCTIDGTPIQYFRNPNNPNPYGTIQGCMEAPYMFKRNGTYYLMYSNNYCQNSTYRVEYSTSTSPLGPFAYGRNNPILETNEDDTVDGPGHHTILEDGGKIYIIYHRHDNPHDPDGSHRQTAADELHFNADGSIAKVVPSHAGIGYLAPSTKRDTDISLGKPATASSSAGAEFAPRYVTDENNGTLWKASEYKFPQWVRVDLGSPRKFARVETEFQYAQIGYQYILESSIDGKVWKRFADRSKNTSWGPMIDRAGVTGRYIRITILGDNNTPRPDPRIGIWNLKVYDGIEKPNQPPVVEAGPGKSGTSAFPTLALEGIVYDDGLPAGPVTTVWTKVSGPGTVTFRNADRRETYATFSSPGKYTLKLTASDGKLASSDTVTYTINPPGQELVRYRLDEPGGNVAVDVSGNAQDGYLQNKATRRSGVTGMALTLDGIGDYMTIPPLGRPGNLTIAAWVKPDSLSSLSAIVSANSEGRTARNGSPRLMLNGNGQFQFSVSGCIPVDQTSQFAFTDKTLGRWTHIAVVYARSAKTVTFYVDGKPDSTHTYSDTQPIDLSVGLRAGAASNGLYFDGKIDDLAIFSTPISPRAVRDIIGGGRWTTIADALRAADGRKVTLKAKAVTYAPRDASGHRTTGFFQIAEPDSTATLRVVDGSAGQDRADTESGVTVSGTMRTDAETGERYLALSKPPEIESCSHVSTLDVRSSSIEGNRALAGRMVAFEAKVISVASDAGSLVTADGTNVVSEIGPIDLVSRGNTVHIVGVVGRAGTKAAGAGTVVLLRDISVIDPPVPPVTNGLVARYKFDESAGAAVSDASGKGNAATLGGGATWASGKMGNGVNLDGRGGHITLPVGIMKDVSDFTICAWVKQDARPMFSRIFDFGSGTDKYMFLCNLGEGGIRYAITSNGNAGGGEKVCETDQPLPLGAWKYVAVTQAGDTVSLYIDGKQVARTAGITLKPSDLGATDRNWIGRSQYNDPTLDGKVDDFRIYNRALTDSEISQISKGY
jgi:hypothetical protein